MRRLRASVGSGHQAGSQRATDAVQALVVRAASPCGRLRSRFRWGAPAPPLNQGGLQVLGFGEHGVRQKSESGAGGHRWSKTASDRDAVASRLGQHRRFTRFRVGNQDVDLAQAQLPLDAHAQAVPEGPAIRHGSAGLQIVATALPEGIVAGPASCVEANGIAVESSQMERRCSSWARSTVDTLTSPSTT